MNCCMAEPLIASRFHLWPAVLAQCEFTESNLSENSIGTENEQMFSADSRANMKCQAALSQTNLQKPAEAV